MKNYFRMRALRLLAGGLVLLQFGGCALTDITELLQTVFLGISAAGSIAILQNI